MINLLILKDFFTVRINELEKSLGLGVVWWKLEFTKKTLALNQRLLNEVVEEIARLERLEKAAA